MNRFRISSWAKCVFGSTALLLLLVPETSLGQDDNKTIKYESTVQLIEAIYQTFDPCHVTPPTRQQVYVCAVRSVYQLANIDAPVDIARIYSGLNNEGAMNEVLIQNIDEVADKITSLGTDDISEFNQQLAEMTVRQLDSACQFISAKELNVRKQIQENRYVGIGIRLGYDQELAIPEILDSLSGGTAKKAGARPGDLILNVDGRDTNGIGLGKVVEWLRGSDGTTVTVTLRNRKETEERKYTINRAEVPFETVQGARRLPDDSWTYRLENADDIGYLKIDSIVGSTAAELAMAWRKTAEPDVKGIVVDMSSVTGAEAHHVALFADQFLKESTFGLLYDGKTRRPLSTSDDRVEIEKPIVFLTAEVVSGPVGCMLNELGKQKGFQVVSAKGGRITTDSICRRLEELPNGLGAIDGFPYATCKPLDGNTIFERHDATIAKLPIKNLPTAIEWIRGNVESK